MYSEETDEYDDGGTPKAHSYPGTAPITRYSLYEPPQTKICYFYKDADVNFQALKLTINPRHYHNVEVLKNELTRKVPGLPFGVRSIYTSRGRHSVDTLDKLEPGGHYVCSTHNKFARAVEPGRTSQVKPWHAGRAPSGKRQLNAFLRDWQRESIHKSERRHAWGDAPRPDNGVPIGPLRPPKKITVIKNGEPMQRHVLLLNRRTAQSFEQVMEDLSQMFQMAVRRMYTIDGRPVKSLSAIFNGPEMYVVSAVDRFKPLTAMSEPTFPPQRHRRRQFDAGSVAARLKEKREKLSRTRGKWRVWVTTNELPSAGTQAQVTLTVYGHKGNSGPMPLGYADGQHFQAGQEDQFDISVGNIGEIFKIRVAHDSTGDFSGWFCDEIRMVDQHTGEELLFRCQRWLSREEDDQEICRELPVVRPNDTILPIIPYEVAVYTGELWNAGTEANVYLTVYGERGDTGVRQLYKADHTNKFHMGQIDVFHMEAVSLGNLKRVIVGHDGMGPGYGWFLDRITIREGPSAKFDWIFPCNRWLDEGEDDGKIVRELKPYDEYNQDLLEKQRFEYERWKFGTQCKIQFYAKATGRAIRIKPDASIDALGESKDDLGLFRVIIKRGMVRVFQNVSNPRYHLAIDNGKLMGQGRGGSYCEFSVEVQEDRSVMLESTKYTAQHVTVLPSGRPGDPRGAVVDTNKEFYVFCKGVFRDGGILMLCTSLTQTVAIDQDNCLYSTGKRNKLAHFRIHKPTDRDSTLLLESVVFPGQFIRFKDGQVDCKGTGDAACHFRVNKVREKGFVKLESLANKGLFIGMTPHGLVRPTVDTGDRNVRLYPEVIEFGRKRGPRSPSPEPLPIASKPQKVRRRRSPTPVSRYSPETEPEPTPRRRTPTPRRRTPSPRQRTPSPEEERPETAQSTYEEGDWKVWLTTAETNEGGDVAMVVYGDQGNSGPIILGRASESNLFQEANQDEFKIHLSNVGKIYKIRLELNATNRKKEPVWKAKELKMQDMTTKETLKFKFNRWLSRKHDDGDTMRELPAIRPKQKVLPVLTYQVFVHTGHEPGSDTDATVHMTLFGERGDTGRRLLLRSNNDAKFQEGQVDKFEVEAVDLGKLKRCVIGHDGMGSGEGWLLEHVVVRESEDADYEYLFPCKKWLDAGIDDKKVERVLRPKDLIPQRSPLPPVDRDAQPVVATQPKEEDKKEKEKPKPGEWRVWVVTGRDDNMGTTNGVSLIAYGDKGVSDLVPLAGQQKEPHFQKASSDEFKVNLGTKLGELYKLRIGHSEADRNSGWFLEKVKMKNLETQEVFTFKVNRWLSRNEEDMDVWRELPVVRPGQQPLPVIVYVVEVYTGSAPGSDTEANLYVQLFGSRGDTGRRELYNCKNNDTPFQEGQVDIFEVEAVSLEDVERVKIGHDGKGKGAGWFCEKVIVKEGEDPSARVFYFPCERWLDEGQDDRQIERTLKAQEPPKQTMGNYKAWIKTARDSKKANGSKVIVTLYGEKGRSKDIELQADDSLFERGNTDEFDMAAGDIGELYKIRVSRADKDKWEGWHLEEVRLKDQDTAEEYTFAFDRWLDRKRDDHDIVRELPVQRDGKDVLPKRHYEVAVHTGDHWAAGTDASVYVTMYGSKGDSGKRWLYHNLTENDDDFQARQVDTFLFEAVTLHELRRLVIGHDGVGHGAGWFLDRVVVTEKDGDRSGQQVVFPCGRWLDDHEEDKKTERELRVLDDEADTAYKPPKKKSKTQGTWRVKVKTSDLHNAGTHAQVYVTAYGDRGCSERRELGRGDPDDDQFEKAKDAEFNIKVGDIGTLTKIRIEHDNSNNFPAWHLEQVTMTDMDTEENINFYVNRWLAADEDDNHLCRELPVLRPDEPPAAVLRYMVAVYTGNRRNASTTANVFITVFGANADSGRRQLEDPQTHNIKWLQGQVDIFAVEAVELGPLQKILLEHDGTDKDSAWLVDKVVIRESQAAVAEYVFPIADWIDADEDRSASREVFTTGPRPTAPLPEKEQTLLQGSEPETQGKWKVWTVTEMAQTTPIKVKASLVVCGANGSSQSCLLTNKDDAEGNDAEGSRKKKDKGGKTERGGRGSDRQADRAGTPAQSHTFKPGQKEEFKIRVQDIGALLKIRLTIDLSGEHAMQKAGRDDTEEDDTQWLLQKIKLKDRITNEEFHFYVDEPIRRPPGDDEARELVLEMPAVRPDLPPMEDMTYRVAMTTGDTPRGDTDAHMYCVLTGEMGDTGRRWLTKSHKPKKFRRGQTDVFELKAVDVGKITKVTVGHDGMGRGRGWFCDKVKVKKSSDAETELLFLVNRWFDTGCDDRQLERDLVSLAEVAVVPEELGDTPPSKGEFKAQMKMSNDAPRGEDNGNNSNNNNNASQDAADLDDHVDWDDWADLNTNNNNGGGDDVASDDDEGGSDWAGWADCDAESAPEGENDHSATYCDWLDLNCNNNSNGRSGDSRPAGLPPRGVISIVVYGEEGVSEAMELDPTDEDVNLRAGDVGEVYKVRVSSGQDDGPGTTWPLEELVLQDAHTKEKLVFDFGPWRGETGGATSKELPAIRPNRDVPQIIQYQVSVATGTSENEATSESRGQKGGRDAKGKIKDTAAKKRDERGKKATNKQKPDNDGPIVFVNLIGTQGDSGPRRLLDPRGRPANFQSGKSEKFTIEAVDLGDIEKVAVTKLPGATWQLDKVVVKKGPFADKEDVFMYEKEFAARLAGEAEDEVELTLSDTMRSNTAIPRDEAPHLPASRGVWNVWATTGRDKNPDTSFTVCVVLCGDKAESTPCPLRPRDKALQPFKSGKTDQFQIRIQEDVGEVEKIRMGFEDESKKSCWCVEEIRFEDEHTHDEFTIEIHDWIRCDEDQESWIEYPIIWPGVETPQVIRYEVEVYTADRHKADTKASVYIILHGEYGDSRKTPLKRSLNSQKKFQQGQMDKFEIDAVDLGKMEKVTIGHSGKGAGAGWLLDKVTVREMTDVHSQEYLFECDRWLDQGEDDGAIERVLLPTEVASSKAEGVPWKVRVVTSKKRGAAHEAHVVMVIYGEKGKTGEIPLCDKPEGHYLPGEMDDFEVLADRAVGRVYKVRVGFAEKDWESQPSWHLDRMYLENMQTGEKFAFRHREWVAVTDKTDGWVEIPVQEEEAENILPVLTYHVEVHTADKPRADTRAHVRLRMEGERGDTGDRCLLASNTNSRMFQKGQMDVFEIKAVDLGDVKQVVAWHDGEGHGSGWYLDKVIVRESAESSSRHFDFPCDRWLDEGEDDGLIARTLVAGVLPPVVVAAAVAESPVQAEDEREEEEAARTPTPQEETSWKIWTVTGSKNGGSRDKSRDNDKSQKDKKKRKEPEPEEKPHTGQVVMVIYGDQDKSEEIPLVSDDKGKFRPGQTDEFDVKVPDGLGQIYKIRVGFSDDTKKDQHWLLHTLILRDMKNEKEYTFELRDELVLTPTSDAWKEIPVNPDPETEDKKDDDEDLQDKEGKTSQLLPVHKYQVSVYTANERYSGTEGEVYLTIYGERGDTGKRKLLVSSAEGDKFQRGKVDQFEVDAVDLLDMTHLVVGHDTSKVGDGWKLDRVIIKASGKAKRYVFPCTRWLDAGEDDGLIERKLDVLDLPNNWAVRAITGEPPEDDSDGSRYENMNNNSKYTDDKKTKKGNQKERKGSAKKDKESQGPTDEVVMVIYGDKGISPEMTLQSDSDIRFLPGQGDDFEVNIAEEIGTPYKVRVGYAGRVDEDQLWWLESFSLTDRELDREYSFELNGSVVRDKENDGWKEIPLTPEVSDKTNAREETSEPLPVYKYQVALFTCEEPFSGTEANVHITIYGDRGDTGKRKLLKPTTDGKAFEEGKVTVFEVEAVELLDLTRVVVGHDTSKVGDGWKLDRVIIKASDKAKRYVFPCKRWLDSGEDDGRIERELDVNDIPNNWAIRAITGDAEESNAQGSSEGHGNQNNNSKYTNDERDKKGNNKKDQQDMRKRDKPDNKKRDEERHGPTDTVVLVIYGDKGISEEVMLASEVEAAFLPGQGDEFEVKVAEDVGTPYKIRVGYAGNLDEDQVWFLESMFLTDRELEREYLFELNGSINRDQENDGWKEIPLMPKKTDAEQEEKGGETARDADEADRTAEEPLPVFKYQVSLYTCDDQYAGTEANVHITIFGERGDTGKRKLLKPTTEQQQLEPGQVTVFDVEAVDLLDLTRVVVGHDGSKVGDGWKLERVIIKASDKAKRYVFPCKRWLDRGEDDGLVERELRVLNLPFNWAVSAVTGDPSDQDSDQSHGNQGNANNNNKKGAKKPSEQEDDGDDPQAPTDEVVMVIYGDKGVSQEMKLVSDSDIKFMPGQEDKFKVQVDEDVGIPYKVRVGYAGEVQGDQTWLLESMSLTSLELDRDYQFHLSGSVVRDVDRDGWKEIPVTPEKAKEGDENKNKTKPDDREDDDDEEDDVDPLPVYKYLVSFHTADEPYADTQANVYLTVFGDRGDTGKRKMLKPISKGKKFGPGKVTVFEVEAVDLLDLTRVVVGHDTSKVGDGWKLDRVIIKASDKAKRYVFPCKRWLDAGEDDGVTERELQVHGKDAHSWTVVTTSGKGPQDDSQEDGKGKEAKSKKKEDKNKKTTKTKETENTEKNNPTDQVVIVIYGDKGKSQEVPLISEKKDLFLPGQTDEFKIQISEEVGKPYKIRLGFAGKNAEDQRWWLDTVKLQDHELDQDYTFDLHGTLTRTKNREGWKEIPRKVTIGRTQKAKGDKAEKLQVHQYQVEVHTADRKYAGTEANVYMTIHGERGDTGKRKLLKSLNNGNDNFKDGQVDIFELESVDLSKLIKVVVGHDGTKVGDGWMLQRVEIRRAAGARPRWVFPCDRWLDVGEDDGCLERELQVQSPQESWTVSLTTDSGSGTCPGPATLVLYGSEGHTDPVTIGAEEGFEFKEGEPQELVVRPSLADGCEELGELYKVRVGLDAMERNPSKELTWSLGKVMLQREGREEQGQDFRFSQPIKWSQQHAGWAEAPVEAQDPANKLPVFQYRVEVYTGDVKHAGTDATVYVHLFGERGDSGVRKLLQPVLDGDKFEQGRMDTFLIEAVSLGKISKIIVGHDGTGFGAGWFLDKIVVLESEDAQLKYLFECIRWLDESEDDGLIERQLPLTKVIKDIPDDGDWKVFVSTSSEENSGTDAQVTLTVFGDKGNTGPLPLGEPGNGLFESGATDQFEINVDPELVGKISKIRIEHDNEHEACGWHVEKVELVRESATGEDGGKGEGEEKLEFPVHRWLDEDEDDGDVVREIAVAVRGGEPKQASRYTVKTVTGKTFGAGTDAHVYLTLYGDHGDSGKRWLRKSREGKNKFEKGKVTTFSLEAIELGQLTKVTVGHDGQGGGAGWFLDKILVAEGDQAELTFPCEMWLDEDEGDGKTERELFLNGKKPDQSASAKGR